MRRSEDTAALPPANHPALIATLGERFYHVGQAVQATRESRVVAETIRRLEGALERFRQAHAVLRPMS